MSNILKVSVPTGGLENTSRTNPISVKDTNIQNVVDPSKVVKPDGQRSNPEKNLGANYESNFQSFITAQKSNLELSANLKQIYFRMSSLAAAGVGKDFAKEITEFLEMTQMTPEDVVKFLQEQTQANNKFSVDIFRTLSELMENTKSVELKVAILNFLKTYNDVSDSQGTLKNITAILKSMTKYMPQSYRQTLLDGMAHLQQSGRLGAEAENIAVLKQEIIPFLSNYTQRTHDMGRVRDFITLLMLNTARYENGTTEKFLADFQKMASFKEFRMAFGEDVKAVFDAFRKEITEVQGNAFADKLLANMQRALNGEGGYEMKTIFQSMMQSLLLNESVYMPLQHLVVPIELFGHQIFSEFWIDPNSRQGGREKGEEAEEQVRKIFIKFDIKNVGFFDLILLHREGILEMQLRYPEELQKSEKEIKKGITDLVEKNGMTCKKLYLSKSDVPISVTEVFPEIYERKNAINVKI
nr:hypothetical protein [uncultured Anaerotignum sp.]